MYRLLIILSFLFFSPNVQSNWKDTVYTLVKNNQDISEQMVIGAWFKKQCPYEVGFYLKENKTFTTWAKKNNFIIWEASGDWWIEENILFWNYTFSSTDRVALGIDKDEILSLTFKKLILKSIKTKETVYFKKGDRPKQGCKAHV